MLEKCFGKKVNKKVQKNSVYSKITFVLQYTLIFKSLGSVHFYFLFIYFCMNTFIQLNCSIDKKW